MQFKNLRDTFSKFVFLFYNINLEAINAATTRFFAQI